jgi:hypothetical protein
MGFEITKITRNYKKLQKVVISKSDEKWWKVMKNQHYLYIFIWFLYIYIYNYKITKYIYIYIYRETHSQK